MPRSMWSGRGGWQILPRREVLQDAFDLLVSLPRHTLYDLLANYHCSPELIQALRESMADTSLYDAFYPPPQELDGSDDGV